MRFSTIFLVWCLMIVLHCCRNWVSVQRLLLVWPLQYADQDGSWGFCRNCHCLLCKWTAISLLMCSLLFNQSIDQSHYWYFSYNWLQFCFQLSSQNSEHDEIDFEFLGNRTGQPYILQTNVFTGGQGNREQRIYLWFDPTKAYHSYSILWNMHQIV